MRRQWGTFVVLFALAAHFSSARAQVPILVNNDDTRITYFPGLCALDQPCVDGWWDQPVTDSFSVRATSGPSTSAHLPSFFNFTFQGIGLEVHGLQDPHGATSVRIQVDNQALLCNTSASTTQTALFATATGLDPSTNHTLMVSWQDGVVSDRFLYFSHLIVQSPLVSSTPAVAASPTTSSSSSSPVISTTNPPPAVSSADNNFSTIPSNSTPASVQSSTTTPPPTPRRQSLGVTAGIVLISLVAVSLFLLSLILFVRNRRMRMRLSQPRDLSGPGCLSDDEGSPTKSTSRNEFSDLIIDVRRPQLKPSEVDLDTHVSPFRLSAPPPPPPPATRRVRRVPPPRVSQVPQPRHSQPPRLQIEEAEPFRIRASQWLRVGLPPPASSHQSVAKLPRGLTVSERKSMAPDYTTLYDGPVLDSWSMDEQGARKDGRRSWRSPRKTPSPDLITLSDALSGNQLSWLSKDPYAVGNPPPYVPQ